MSTWKSLYDLQCALMRGADASFVEIVDIIKEHVIVFKGNPVF